MVWMVVQWGWIDGQAWGDEVVELSPLVVEGTHFDGLWQEFAGGALRLEWAEIRGSGAGSVPELLERMAGIRFSGYTGSGSEGQLALRGFGENSGLRVLVLVDGQVYNPPDMGGINWLGIELEELESVEVLRGGQTVLYGNHAVAGVVKLRTRVPGEETRTEFTGEMGSDGKRRGSVLMESRHWGTGWRLGGSWAEGDGWREDSAHEGRNAYLSWQREGRATRWSGRLSYADSKLQFPGPLGWEAFRENPRQSAGGGEDRSESVEWQFTLHGEGDLDLGSWEIDTGYLERDADWILDGREAANDLQRLTLNARLKRGGESAFLITGIDASMDRLDHEELLEPGSPVVLSWADVERITAGAYAYGPVEVTDDWILSGGVRAERAESEYLHVHYVREQLLPELETNRGTVPNPNYRNPADRDPLLSFEGPVGKGGWAAELSLLRRLLPDRTLWVGVDRVYRYPSLDETAAYQGYPLSDPLNDQLDAETGTNIEIGFKQDRGRWQTGLTAFHLDMAGEIGYMEEVVDGQLRRLNTNFGDTRRYGVEAFHGYHGQRHGFSGNLSRVAAMIRESNGGGGIPLVPRWEGSVSAWFKPSLGTRLLLQGRYTGSRLQGNDRDGNLRRIPAATVVHLAFRWEPHPSLTLAIGIDNLFDKSIVSTAYSGGFYPAAGRQVHVRVRCGF